ncbi:CASP-like protein [Zostera marina]|uniref:CASP-like protein n=1 Tax=Zostera marina TaxID=29655 RepID=A0A0K9PXW7_ZOSMR|nr:CASP-like protein [Zostera marina]
MSRVFIAEGVLRLFAMCFSIGAACILGFNKETKMLLVVRTATVKDFLAFWVLTIVLSVAGGYHFLQLCKCIFQARCTVKSIETASSSCKKWEACLSLFFDQILAYVVVATVAVAIQVGLLGISGQDVFQWIKLADKYRKYSMQSAGGIGCALIASASMTLLNIISSHQFFRFYPSDTYTYTS